MAFVNQYGYAQQPMYPTYLPQQTASDQMNQMRMPQQYAPQVGGVPIQQMNQPVQQAQQCCPVWVQGEAGAKSFLVAPGQSVFLMDSEAEVFYIKETDMAGVPKPLRIFDYKERSNGAYKPVQAAQVQSVDYVTRGEFEALVARIAELTAKPEKNEVQSVPSRRRAMREGDMIDA